MNYTDQEVKEHLEKRFLEDKERINGILAKRNININDKVAIEYETYSNCGPKRRTLNNLVINEILEGSIKFTQQGKRQKSFWINNSDIFTIYKA